MKKTKRKLELYDTLRLESKEETFSKWQGEKGLYVFKQGESKGSRSPVRQVYLNREYFTGLFKTKKAEEFSGDLKDSFDNSRKYLSFIIESGDTIKIYVKK